MRGQVLQKDIIYFAASQKNRYRYCFRDIYRRDTRKIIIIILSNIRSNLPDMDYPDRSIPPLRNALCALCAFLSRKVELNALFNYFYSGFFNCFIS